MALPVETPVNRIPYRSPNPPRWGWVLFRTVPSGADGRTKHAERQSFRGERIVDKPVEALARGDGLVRRGRECGRVRAVNPPGSKHAF